MTEPTSSARTGRRTWSLTPPPTGSSRSASPQDGGNRFFWFDLFSSNVTYGAGQVGYSAKNSDNTTDMNKVIIPSAGGVFTSFYPFSTNWRKASMDIDSGNGAAITKTNIAKTSFTGWYPNTGAYPYEVNGYGCEGGAAYGSDVLLFRNYKNGTVLETHLYQAGNALDAAAINAATDLGNMTPGGSHLCFAGRVRDDRERFDRVRSLRLHQQHRCLQPHPDGEHPRASHADPGAPRRLRAAPSAPPRVRHTL